jgi:hypothetical protein
MLSIYSIIYLIYCKWKSVDEDLNNAIKFRVSIYVIAGQLGKQYRACIKDKDMEQALFISDIFKTILTFVAPKYIDILTSIYRGESNEQIS